MFEWERACGDSGLCVLMQGPKPGRQSDPSLTKGLLHPMSVALRHLCTHLGPGRALASEGSASPGPGIIRQTSTYDYILGEAQKWPRNPVSGRSAMRDAALAIGRD